MKPGTLLMVAAVCLGPSMVVSAQNSATQENEKMAEPADALSFTVKSIDGADVDLDQYRGNVVLIVNVASRCGLTPQYKELQSLYDKYGEQGLVVLGFPCNQFMGQEPGTDEQIKEFCTTKYQVEFPMFSKINVNGKNQAPLYAYLTTQETKPTGSGKISWNFEKFLVGRDGKVIARFGPRMKPTDTAVISSIEAALNTGG